MSVKVDTQETTGYLTRIEAFIDVLISRRELGFDERSVSWS